MKRLGGLSFLVGLVVSAIAAARPASLDSERLAALSSRGLLTAWADLALMPYLVGLTLMIIGVVLARWRRPGLHTSVRSGAAESSPEALLARVEAQVAALDLEAPAEVLTQAISGLIEGEMTEFVEHGPAISSRLGLLAYSELIGDFALAERSLARAWSALIDGAEAEVPSAVRRSQAALQRVREQLERSAPPKIEAS